MEDVRALKTLLASVSHPIRLDVLLFVSERGEVSYTDLLFLTEKHGVKPNILAYHMKRLKNGLLIHKNKNRKYRLTDKGRSLVKGLASVSEGFANTEKKQWLQNSEQPLRITRSFIHALTNRFGVPDYALNTVVEEVYSKVQSLPNQTIPMTLIIDLVNNSLVEHGLYGSLNSSLQLGITVSDLREHESSVGLDSSVAREVLTNRFLFDYFLIRYLPLELQDAHYLGRINLEDGGNPYLPSRIFMLPDQLGVLWKHEEHRHPPITHLFKVLSQLASREVVAVNPQEPFTEYEMDADSSSFWLLLSELNDISLPGVRFVLSYTFPSSDPPRSDSSQKSLSNIMSSKLVRKPTQEGPPLVYYLPSSVLFIKEYKAVLEEIVEYLYEQETNALFVNQMSPYQRSLLYSYDGLKAPLNSDAITGVAGFASINMPLLAHQSKGNRSLFLEYVLDAAESISKYFVQKQHLTEQRNRRSPTPISHAFEFFHYLNLYSLEETPKILADNYYPSRDAISFILELIEEIKADTATLSRDNNLKILVSSIAVKRETHSLFRNALPPNVKEENPPNLSLVVEKEYLIHGEALLQRHLDGGYTPTISLSSHKASPRHEYLLRLLSEEDLSIVPLFPS